MKKFIFIFLTLSVFLLAFTQLDFQIFRKGPSGCPFCNKEVLEAQTFYKEGETFGILTHKPAVPGHVLIIPERHVERFEDLTTEEIAALGETIKKVDAIVRSKIGNRDYLILQKNGRAAGQSVPHVHFHYLPATKFLALRFFLSPWLKPLSAEELHRLQAFYEQI